jgi:hypothetical protein
MPAPLRSRIAAGRDGYVIEKSPDRIHIEQPQLGIW